LLETMLAGIPGSIGAMFLDHEGEAVAVVGRRLPRYDAQIIGAYEGIFLSQVRRLCSALDFGTADRFKIECEGALLLLVDLKDGYYLVLVAAPDTPEGVAWQRLTEAREKLLEEI
jgi:predicted regulator of Ras-like GTPase activity (Roadblock/LC7/MglB family)